MSEHEHQSKLNLTPSSITSCRLNIHGEVCALVEQQQLQGRHARGRAGGESRQQTRTRGPALGPMDLINGKQR